MSTPHLDAILVVEHRLRDHVRRQIVTRCPIKHILVDDG